MLTFILDRSNQPFTVALGLMVAIALLEGVSALMGAGLSGFIDALLPDTDVDLDVDVDGDVDLDTGVHSGPLDVEAPDLHEVGAPGALSRILGWLHVGRVPVLVLLVFFLMGFGLAGFAVQTLARNLFGAYLPAFLASLPAAAVSFGFVRVVGGALARLIPKDETEAVSGDSFVGRVAHITLGEASRGSPAEARLRDRYGQAHYMMVEPEEDGDRFPAGTAVLLVRRQGARYYGIPNPNEALVDPPPDGRS